MGWLRKQLDELRLLLFMMVGISPPRDLQERAGLLKSDKKKPEREDKQQ